MLTERVDYLRGAELLAQENAERYDTVLPLRMFNTKPLFISPKTPVLGGDPVYNPGGGDVFTCGEQCMVIDKYYPDPPLEDGGYKFQTGIPTVLQLDTTDKTTRGVFEKPLQTPTLSSVPLDATPLNNDATDGLTTFRQLGASPLGTGYNGGSAYIQPTDPQPVYYPEDEQYVEPEPGCGTFDIACKFNAIKGQTTILIVGIILLGVGVFALTR